MKRTLSLIAVLSMLVSMLLVAAPTASAAATGYWIDRKGADLTEPYEEAKDETYEPIPGSLSSSGAFGIAGATFSLPIGKEAFKVSFDMDWVTPKRFDDSNESSAQKNFFIWLNFGYTANDEMEPWVGFDESKAPWETASEASFTVWSHKLGVSYPAYTDGRELAFPAVAEGVESEETDANLIDFETKEQITDKIEWVTPDAGMNLARAGTTHFVLELKNDVVTLSATAKGTTYTAKAHFKKDYFNSKTERYFAITHFNGAFVWDIKNFKIESSDIASSVGATAKGREYDADGNPITNNDTLTTTAPGATTTTTASPSKTTADGKGGNQTTAAGNNGTTTTAPGGTDAPDASDTSDVPAVDNNPDNSTTGDSSNDGADDGDNSSTGAPGDDQGDDEAGFPIWAIVVIAVVVLAGAGVAVFFVLKKKKA